MKRAGFFLVLCAMLILSLTACGSKPAGTNNDGGGTSVTDSAKARTRSLMTEGESMMRDAEYFAAPNGRVRGSDKTDLMEQMRSAADKMAEGSRQAEDMTGKASDSMAHR